MYAYITGNGVYLADVYCFSDVIVVNVPISGHGADIKADFFAFGKTDYYIARYALYLDVDGH